MKLCYLAGPIDFVSREEATGWRTEAANRLLFVGIASYNPAAAFRAPSKEWGRLIDEINRRALRRCDHLLVFIGPDQRAFGTIREIEFATTHAIPVHIIAPTYRDSFCAYDLNFCGDLREAVEMISAHSRQGGLTSTAAGRALLRRQEG